MEQSLYRELKKYCKGSFYGFHMPGHKRNPAYAGEFPGMWMDITEINGFDNLHHPEGILRRLQEKTAELYGAEETLVSVNGSTAALLSAISASVKRNGSILAARNCHKAVYHGIYMRNLKPYYVYPQFHEACGLNGGILASDVENILKEKKEIEAVLITSPTYDGMVSDVRKIAEIVHRYDLPLIVDEAHGAHFPFSDYFPESAISMGADLVIQSLHKTLPALTQTAVLHRMTDRVDGELLRRFMGIYQTSSPSYLLMSSVDYCIDKINQDGTALFEKYTQQLENTREELRKLQRIKLIGEEEIGHHGVYDFDRSKIILSVRDCNITGPQLHERFRKECALEMEMEAEDYLLALSSVGDTIDGFRRLAEGALKIDGSLKSENTIQNKKKKPEAPVQRLLPAEAMEREWEMVSLEASVGRSSAEFAYLYPPGIPLIVPGEIMTLQLLEDMRRYQEQGMEIQGLADYNGKTIRVVKKS